jgi:hypothetical protein
MRRRANATVHSFPAKHQPESVAAPEPSKALISRRQTGIQNAMVDEVSTQQQEDSGLDVRDVLRAINATLDRYFPGASPKQREIMKDNIEIALLEGSSYRSLRKELEPSLLSQLDLREPVRELSKRELLEISAIAKANPWDRRVDGDNRNPLRWLEDHYGKFLPGVLTNHIRQADCAFYQSLMKEIGRKGLPTGMDFPTRDENERRKMAAALRAKPGDTAVREVAVRREKNRARGRAFRARHANLG